MSETSSYSPFVLEAVRTMVDSPDEVFVEERYVDGARTFFVTVAADDVGKVIGKGGRVVMALRTVVSALAAKARERAYVKVVTEQD